MKKYLMGAAITALSLVTLSSCSDDPANVTLNPDIPSISSGAFILCQGSYYNAIEGSLDGINYQTGTCTKNIFRNVNNRSLGNTPQCGLAYGAKIYLGIYGSNTVEVIEKSDYRSIKQIKLENLSVGNGPRSMVAQKGFVYVAMEDGKVARLDTITLEFDKSVNVGPFPEVIAIHNNRIYTPDSDGMNYPNYGTTASEITLDNFQVSKTFDVPFNPYKFISAGGKLFMIAKGDYSPDLPAALYEIKSDYSAVKIADATLAAAFNNKIYFINAPFYDNITDYTYSVYDISTGKVSEWEIEHVEYPNEIGVDPVTGNIIICSLDIDGQWPSYTLPGFAYEFDSNNKLVKKYNVGVVPAWIFFNTH